MRPQHLAADNISTLEAELDDLASFNEAAAFSCG